MPRRQGDPCGAGAGPAGRPPPPVSPGKGGEQVCAWRSHVVLPRGRKMGSFDLNRVFLLLRAFSTPGPSSRRRV